jgi:hypothetical protein
MPELAERRAAERQAVGPAESFQSLDGRIARGTLSFHRPYGRKLDGFFKQTRGVTVDLHPMGGSLASELSLQFGPDIKHESYRRFLFAGARLG